MKKLYMLFVAVLIICSSRGQVRTPTLYITGTVNADEKMLVSVLHAKTTAGNTVSAELNGKKTETKTNNKGQAILDFSSIAVGLNSETTVLIKTFDKKGELLQSASTIVRPAGGLAAAKPFIEQLPKNISNAEAITIHGKNLGAEAKLLCGNQVQETLAASDKEIIFSTNVKTGMQPVYVVTPNGVSESQMVNVYSLDFSLPKSSVRPKENVQAMVHYESIPEGTKLIFGNKSPEIIKMQIPGAANTASECIYRVTEQNGSLPVNITGLLRGNFTISLDPEFVHENKDTIPAKINSWGISLNTPADGAIIKKIPGLHFAWSAKSGIPEGGYEIMIKKLKPNQSVKDAFSSNKVFYSQDKILNNTFSYPLNAPRMDTGKYLWSVRPIANQKTYRADEGFGNPYVFYIPFLNFNPTGTNPPTEPTAPCPPPDKQELWGSHYYPCTVTEYYTTQPGLSIAQQEALNKTIKKIKKLPVVGKGAKLAALIAGACSIHGLYNLWIHIEQPYQTYRYDYACVNGKWVLKNIEQGTVFYNDLGWVRVYIGGGVGTYEINGTESDAEITNAINEAIANACK